MPGSDGHEFRTYHFDGVVRVPGYVQWLMRCDMRETYAFHKSVLKLLQWHCKPNLWHLRTPVHMFALDAFVDAYPDAKFLWSHRDPAKVLGSVCSLIAYIRSWSSDRKDPEELGAEQLAWWVEAIERAMDFRKKFGDDRFVDVSFADLQTDPVNTVASATTSWASHSATRPEYRSRNGPPDTSPASVARTPTNWPTTG